MSELLISRQPRSVRTKQPGISAAGCYWLLQWQGGATKLSCVVAQFMAELESPEAHLIEVTFFFLERHAMQAWHGMSDGGLGLTVDIVEHCISCAAYGQRASATSFPLPAGIATCNERHDGADHNSIITQSSICCWHCNLARKALSTLGCQLSKPQSWGACNHCCMSRICREWDDVLHTALLHKVKQGLLSASAGTAALMSA